MPDPTPHSAASAQTRKTRQRDALRSIVAEAEGPLSVPELLVAAQQRLESIGIATVYRTVRMMEEAGELRAVVLPGGETRWEASDRGHHHHFQCRICSRVTDFHGCPLHIHAGSLPAGFVVENHEVTLMGLCPACAHPSRPTRTGRSASRPETARSRAPQTPRSRRIPPP